MSLSLRRPVPAVEASASGAPDEPAPGSHPERAGAAGRRRFSIVIPHRNGREMLRTNLGILRVTTRPGSDEVVVVDNHSTDGSAEMVRREFPEVMLIANGCNRGFATACNQGIRHATGEFVLLLNSDAFLLAATLDRLEEVLRSTPRAAAVGAQLVDGHGSELASEREEPRLLRELGVVFGKRWREGIGIPRSLAEVEAVPGACVATRMDAIRDAGALDERFLFYFEDVEWCRRFRSRGWRVYLAPAARAIHLGAASSRMISRAAQVEMLRSRLIFYRQVYPGPVAALLEGFRAFRIGVNALTQALALVVSAGRSRRSRRKLKDYCVLLAWLVRGKPETWGFPDKCVCRTSGPCTRIAPSMLGASAPGGAEPSRPAVP